MQWVLKAKLLKAKFYVNIMIRFGKKEQNDHCMVMVEKTESGFEVSNTRSSNPPCTWDEYCEHWDKSKF